MTRASARAAFAKRTRRDGNGGGGRNRTGVDGFAGRCITTLLPRRNLYGFPAKRESIALSPEILERETSLELATSTLARLRSTN